MMVVASTLTTLTEYAQQVLTVAEQALALTDAGVPDRSYISASAPAFDCCPFVAVTVAGLAEASTSPLSPVEASARRHAFGNIILASYTLVAVRCSPSMDGNNFPAVADLEASAVEVQQDGWMLWNHLRSAVKNGDIFTDCEGVHFDGGQPIRDEGMCVGWIFRIRAMIPGIPS